MTDHDLPPEALPPEALPPEVLSSDLLALWAGQDETVRVADQAELIESLRATHRRENKILRWLNIQEVVPAIAGGAFFLWLAAEAASRQWALVLAAFFSFAVGAFMIISTVQQRAAELAFSTTMRGELQRSLSQVHHRAWLYRNVGWWYLLPIAAAFGLTRFAAMGEVGTADFIFMPAFAAMLVGLWFLNRRIGRNRYEPEVRRYEGLLADLDG